MPLYDYQCVECSHVFELRQSFDAEPQGTCPQCNSTARRKFHPVPVIYKGSGFYTTDYAQNRNSSAYKKDKEEEEKAEKKGTAKASTEKSKTDSSKEESSTTSSTTTSTEKAEVVKEA